MVAIQSGPVAMPIPWKCLISGELASGQAAKRSAFPAIPDLKAYGNMVAPDDELEGRYYLRVQAKDAFAIRAFLADFADSRDDYDIEGVFSWREAQVRIDRVFHGMRITFHDKRLASVFRLRFTCFNDANPILH